MKHCPLCKIVSSQNLPCRYAISSSFHFVLVVLSSLFVSSILDISVCTISMQSLGVLFASKLSHLSLQLTHLVSEGQDQQVLFTLTNTFKLAAFTSDMHTTVPESQEQDLSEDFQSKKPCLVRTPTATVRTTDSRDDRGVFHPLWVPVIARGKIKLPPCLTWLVNTTAPFL